MNNVFFRTLEVFKSWKDDDLKELASGGRNMEYLCDKVIEEDSTKSEFVTIITKVSYICFCFVFFFCYFLENAEYGL